MKWQATAAAPTKPTTTTTATAAAAALKVDNIININDKQPYKNESRTTKTVKNIFNRGTVCLLWWHSLVTSNIRLCGFELSFPCHASQFKTIIAINHFSYFLLLCWFVSVWVNNEKECTSKSFIFCSPRFLSSHEKLLSIVWSNIMGFVTSWKTTWTHKAQANTMGL